MMRNHFLGIKKSHVKIGGKLFVYPSFLAGNCLFTHLFRRESNVYSPYERPLTSSDLMTSSLRPSTSSRPESVLEKLKIETSDDGGGIGITIGGVFISANCSIILIVMASIFILVGSILSAISFRPRDINEELDRFLSRQEWASQLKVIGPVTLVVGLIMLIMGTTFCFLGWKVTKDDERRFNESSMTSSVIKASFLFTIKRHFVSFVSSWITLTCQPFLMLCYVTHLSP